MPENKSKFNRSRGAFLGPKVLDTASKMKKPKKSLEKEPEIKKVEPNPISELAPKEAPKEAPEPIPKKIGRQTPLVKKLPNDTYPEAPGGYARDGADQSSFRHNRMRDVGFKIGKYIQTPPLLFTRDGHSIYLGDIYRGASAFLIAGGPSFKDIDIEKLSSAGFLTFGLNNSVKSFRPNLWTCVDDPTHFIKSLWLDPKILKFAPMSHADKKIFDNETWKETERTVGDCPNVLYYRRNEDFKADQYLFEDTVNWGNHTKLGGGRSVMLAALRLSFYLGIRKVFLLGVDFDMDENNKYHFEQSRTKQSIKNNNDTYSLLKSRFEQLRPIFEENDFQVFNCNPKSGLKVFDFISFEDAIKLATETMPENLETEKTDGLYDREASSKKGKEKAKIKKELDQAREVLNKAKKDIEDIDTDKISTEDYKKLEQNVVDKRRIFRSIERKKNKIWYGSPERPTD